MKTLSCFGSTIGRILLASALGAATLTIPTAVPADPCSPMIEVISLNYAPQVGEIIVPTSVSPGDQEYCDRNWNCQLGAIAFADDNNCGLLGNPIATGIVLWSAGDICSCGTGSGECRFTVCQVDNCEHPAYRRVILTPCE